MIVESVAGPSQFTMDPNRHRLMEATLNLPPDTRAPVLLPDRQTTEVLVRSYFTNVSCMSFGCWHDFKASVHPPGSWAEHVRSVPGFPPLFKHNCDNIRTLINMTTLTFDRLMALSKSLSVKLSHKSSTYAMKTL